MPLTSTKPEYAFLQGGGEMGVLTRAFNWSETSLGAADGWPQSLRTTLGIVLHSAFPMFLFWGSDLLCFYNDAYRPSLGTDGKHPGILGKPGKEAWPEMWDFIGPLIQQVMTTGEPVWFEDQLVPIYRNGQLEDAYWTFSYSPAYNDTGQVGGVFVTCTETTEKVATIKKLQASEAELSFAIDAAELAIWDLDPATNIFKANTRLKDWFGLASHEDIDLSQAIQVMAEKDGQRVVEAIGQAMRYESGGIYDIQYTIIHPVTGYERVVRANGKVQFSPDQTPLRFNGIIQDITEQQLAEQIRRAGEARFQTMVEQAPVAMALFSGPDFVITLANERVLEYWGRQREQVMNKPLFEALPETIGQGFEALLTDVLTTGKPFIAKELPVMLERNGQLERTYIDFVYEPFRNADGTISGVTVVCIEITEQVLARQKIEESEAKFRQSQQQLLALFEQSPVAVATISEDNLTFQIANLFYGQLVGRTPEELIGKPLLEALPELRGQGFDDLLRQVIKTGIPYVATEVAVDIVRQKQLETIYVDLAYQPQREVGTDHISGVFVVATDVTQQVRSRQRVEASEAKLQSLIAAAPVAIGLFMGRDLVVELPNQTFIDIVGKGPDIVGKPLREVMPELLTENQPFLQILDDVYTSGKMFQSFGAQVKIVQQGVMTENYYNITYTPLFNKAGEVYAILDIAVDVTGQILAQQELTQQKAYLQNALDIADLGTYQVDVNTNTGYYTDNVRQWYGLPSVRESMDVIFAKIHPDDRAFVKQTIDDTLITEDQNRHDITYRLADDSGKTIRYLRSMGKALYENGKSYAINGILQDVTSQIQARQDIETSEAKLRSLVESAPFPIGVYVGREMRIQLANQSILDVWGKGNEVVGKLYSEILPELANQSIFDQLDAVYTTGIPFHAKNQRVDIVVDGSLQPFYFNYSFTPLYDAAGRVYGVMNTAAEITELVTAKQQVEDAEAALRGAVELAELVTWDLDINRSTITYSKRFMDWLGFSEDTKDLDEAYNPLPDEYRKSVPAALEATWQPGGSGFYENEHPVINRLTGQVRIIHAQAQVSYDADGEPTFLRGTAQDVTEQRRLQQELERQVAERTRQLQATVLDLERSNQNLQQFAYIASHDLQEPLRKIQSFGDILKTQYVDSLGEGIDLLQRMQMAASRMSVLIKDLLAFSRISTRQENATIVPLTKVVSIVLTDLELTIQETNAVMDIDPLPTVQGDPSQLGQLFQNLLSNALKFRRTDASGAFVSPIIRIGAQQLPASYLPLSVRPTRETTTYHRIDVVDNGIGFEQKYVDRIFQVFQRLHGRKEFVGTGIGLAICEKVVANHGGAITATSQPGQGATFSVYLPVTIL